MTKLQSRNSSFSLQFQEQRIKTKKNGDQRGSRSGNRSKVTTGHPPENRNLNFYFPRRSDTESRFKRTEGSRAHLVITVVSETTDEVLDTIFIVNWTKLV